MTVFINHDLCSGCGICGEVCPRHVPVTSENNGSMTTAMAPERATLCMECGHCAAVCPQGAVTVPRFGDREFEPVEDMDIDVDDFLTFLRQRRSVRRYRDEPVPREVIERMLQASRCAPTGTGKGMTGVIVIDDKNTLGELATLVYGMYEGLEKGLKNPVARFFIRRQSGEKGLRVLRDFVMPGMHWYIRWHREGRGNEIFRDCPALMLFHAPAFEPAGEGNCHLAAYHTILMGHALGVGTCFNGLVPPACNRVPKIRRLLGLPEGQEVYASLTMGYPRYPFKRVVPRDLEQVRYLAPAPEMGGSD